MQYQIQVENIKCSGCMHTIKNSLLNLSGVQSVNIDKDTETVSIEAKDDLLNILAEKLASLGYPAKGDNNLIHKAKSYVSCAIGRINED